jgi:hypothetical protein
MMRPFASAARTPRLVPLALGAAALLGGCAAGPRGNGTPPPPSDAEWRALAAPRPLSARLRLGGTLGES